MQKKSIKIPNINCSHCVRTIENELSALDHVVKVKAYETTKMIEISWNEPQTWENIKTLLAEINYPVTEA